MWSTAVGDSAVVEGSGIIRQNQDQAATRSRDSFPLQKRLHRIGEMLQVVGRQDEVVTLVRDTGEVGSIYKDISSWRLVTAERVGVGMSSPGSIARKVTIIQRPDTVVDWQRSEPALKHGAGTANLQALSCPLRKEAPPYKQATASFEQKPDRVWRVLGAAQSSDTCAHPGVPPIMLTVMIAQGRSMQRSGHYAAAGRYRRM